MGLGEGISAMRVGVGVFGRRRGRISVHCMIRADTNHTSRRQTNKQASDKQNDKAQNRERDKKGGGGCSKEGGALLLGNHSDATYSTCSSRRVRSIKMS